MSHRRRWLATLLLAFSTSLCQRSATHAEAGTQDGAVIALHAKNHTTKPSSICTTWRPSIPCTYYMTNWPVGKGADVYMVVGLADQGPGIGGLACGIEYDPRPGSGVDLFGYSLCADFDAPDPGWPASGSGNRFTWNPVNNCQRTVLPPTGVRAIACSFYVYAYHADEFAITGYGDPPFAHVYDCAGNDSSFFVHEYYWNRASVGFGWLEGFNPCLYGSIPIEAMTWGRIKTRYR